MNEEELEVSIEFQKGLIAGIDLARHRLVNFATVRSSQITDEFYHQLYDSLLDSKKIFERIVKQREEDAAQS